MASVHAAHPSAPPTVPLPSSHGGAGIPVEELKRVDINSLSQSELQALSLCSDSAYDVRRTDDVVCPHLDRSVFNESAGSRRQTYSRLHHRSHSRLPGLHPSLKPHRHPHFSSDHVSHSIVHFLKHYLSGNRDPPPPPPAPPSPPPPPQEEPKPVVAPNVDLGFLGLQEKLKAKRKRVRKSKNNLNKKKLMENGVGMGMGMGMELEQVNSKGEVVDLVELEKKGDELYNEELRKGTTGLETEDGVLGFLWGLEGQWCSRRKKRKYVDAAVFADALPIGWKLLLGLRRRDFRVSVYCRRYISPSGQQFLSCKEAASFLKSYFGARAADQHTDQRICSSQQACNISSDKSSHPADKANDAAHDVLGHSILADSSSNAHDDCLKGIENLPEVKVQDIFECVKCNLRFDEKNAYLQHLFSFHQKTSKRYKLGTPVGEGVIIKDGKYECQFCHKIFEERRSYNGHVGIHVRNSGKNTNEPTAPVDPEKKSEPPLQEEISSRSSKMDALIEIAHNSIFETSTIDTGEQAITSSHSASVLSLEETQAAPKGDEADLCPDPVEIQKEDSTNDSALDEALNHDTEVMTMDNDIGVNDYAWNVSGKMDTCCVNDSEPAGTSEIGNCESSLDMGYENRCLEVNGDHPEDTPAIAVRENVFHDAVSPVSLVQSFQFFPPFDSVANKGESEFSVAAQKIESVADFEELRFDDMEAFRYDFVNEQELPSLPVDPMSLRTDTVIDDGFNPSVGFGSEEVLLDANQLTVCVWCTTEFKLEGIDAETPSDSIGYMCPTCKAKISGHYSDGLSMDPSSL